MEGLSEQMPPGHGLGNSDLQVQGDDRAINWVVRDRTNHPGAKYPVACYSAVMLTVWLKTDNALNFRTPLSIME